MTGGVGGHTSLTATAATSRSVSTPRAGAALPRGARSVLRLVCLLPYLSPHLAARLAGRATVSRTYADLQRLSAAGLVWSVPAYDWLRGAAGAGTGGPARPRHLYAPTPLGLACAARLARERPLRCPTTRAVAAEALSLPQLAACHALLGFLLSLERGTFAVREWVRPWYPPDAPRGPGSRCLPALVVLARQPECTGEAKGTAALTDPATGECFALLPESPLLDGHAAGLPVTAHGAAVRGVRRLRERLGAAGHRGPTLVVATTPHRADAWAGFLTREGPLDALVVTRTSGGFAVVHRLGREHEYHARTWRESPQPEALATTGPEWLRRGRRAAGAMPASSCFGAGLGGCPGGDLSGDERRVLDAAARHPFLPVAHLAAVAGLPAPRAAAARERLIERGLLCAPGAGEVGHAVALRLSEATRVGVAVAARQLGLPPYVARAAAGVLGGGTGDPDPGRERLLGLRLRHTLGSDAFFVRLLCVARALAAAGGDDRLDAWLGPGAAAPSGARPDGAGEYRRGGRRYTFFLEYERGTLNARDLRIKLQRYHRKAACGLTCGGPAGSAGPAFPARSCPAGVPCVLFVAGGAAQERRIVSAARAVGAQALSGASSACAGLGGPLPILVTTRALLDSDPLGPAGPVWRDPASERRRAWPLPPDGELAARVRPWCWRAAVLPWRRLEAA